MTQFGNAYLWLKAAHLFGVVCWFAGLFYLPRLFVYHTSTDDEPGKARFRTMEAKLYRIIMRPAMLITLVFGLWITYLGWQAFSTSIWLWLKLLAILVLLVYPAVREFLQAVLRFASKRLHAVAGDADVVVVMR